MTSEALAGKGLMQSRQEWEARNRSLADSMSGLINRFAVMPGGATGRGIDVGCQAGALTDAMAETTPFGWTGIDPGISEARTSSRGQALLPGTADALPFADASFEVALFANVYEHVLPERRADSLLENPSCAGPPRLRRRPDP